MQPYRIAVLVEAACARRSHNRRTRWPWKSWPASARGSTTIDDIPLYNQDHDSDFPAQGTRLKNAIRRADAVLFVTAEYNRSIPGVLKNAIDTASRPYGDGAFDGKPAAVIGTSPGAAGTAMAQQHLRNVLVFVNLSVMAQPEAFLQWGRADQADGERDQRRYPPLPAGLCRPLPGLGRDARATLNAPAGREQAIMPAPVAASGRGSRAGGAAALEKRARRPHPRAADSLSTDLSPHCRPASAYHGRVVSAAQKVFMSARPGFRSDRNTAQSAANSASTPCACPRIRSRPNRRCSVA